MNSLSPSKGNGTALEKHVVDDLNNDILSINQRLSVDESNISSNAEDVAFAIAKNSIQDSRLDALENKQDYDINRLDVDIVSGNTISATTLTTVNFQTDTISADNLDLNGTLNVSDIDADTLNADALTSNAITSTSVNAGNADITTANIGDAVITDLTSSNILSTDIAVSGTANVNNLMANRLVTSDAITGTTDLTSIKFRNETHVSDLPNAFRYIKIPIIQNGYYGVEYISTDADNLESFSVMVYQNNGTVMVSYSQNDVNVLHKFYYDSTNKNLWIETTNDIDNGTVKWSSADTETHNLAEFYRDITIDTTAEEVFGQLVKRLHGWVLIGDHTVSYGMDIMGGLTADLLTPSQFSVPFQRFYPEGTPVEAIYTDLIGNLGVGRFETSGYYGTALNKVEALNRIKIEENKITWTIDTDYGWDNLIWENWGEAETIPYDIGLITTSNVWDRAVNDPFEPVTITLTIHNTVGGTVSTITGFNFITLTDIPETGYALQGFATEDGGEVVYNIGDRITEDTELWTVYQRTTNYIYDSENDPNYDPTDLSSPYWNDVGVIYFDAPIEAVCPEGTTAQNITFTVETDAELNPDVGASSFWLNGYSVNTYNSDIGALCPGAQDVDVVKVEDGIYELSWTLNWNQYFEEFTPGESYPIAGFGNFISNIYFDAFSGICLTSDMGTYFKVRDNPVIEDI